MSSFFLGLITFAKDVKSPSAYIMASEGLFAISYIVIRILLWTQVFLDLVFDSRLLFNGAAPPLKVYCGAVVIAGLSVLSVLQIVWGSMIFHGLFNVLFGGNVAATTVIDTATMDDADPKSDTDLTPNGVYAIAAHSIAAPGEESSLRRRTATEYVAPVSPRQSQRLASRRASNK